MSSLIETLESHYKNSVLSHAYLLEGEKNTVKKEILNFLENVVNIAIHGNPDLFCGDFETLKIDDARGLKTRANMKTSTTQSRKFFITSFDFITTEAQNSLLKLFEEPPQQNHFFIIIPNSDLLLPTLHSRLNKIASKDKKGGDKDKAEAFLNSTPPERIKSMQKVIKEKDKAAALSFLKSLEYSFYNKINIKNAGQEEINILEEFQKCRNYLLSPSPSVKMIIQHIAVITPQL